MIKKHNITVININSKNDRKKSPIISMNTIGKLNKNQGK